MTRAYDLQTNSTTQHARTRHIAASFQQQLHSSATNAMLDQNTVYDLGAPRSIVGIDEAVKLCHLLEIDLHLSPPQENYVHGWGEDCQDPRHVVCV